MKGFTARIKKEILSHLPSDVCCRRSMLAGILINSECGIDGSVYIKLSGEETAETAAKLIFEVYGIETAPEYSKNYGRKTAEGIVSSSKLSSLLGSLSDPGSISSAPSFFRCPECPHAFAAGLCLGSASFSDPEKEARCEISILDPAVASKVSAFFQSQSLYPSLSVRKGTSSVLFKKNEDTETLLAMSGAPMSAMELMQSGLMRDFKRDLNRRSNCEINNIAASSRAAASQLAAIALIRSRGGFGLLDKDLQRTAELREDFPEASLSELCQRHNPPISKSGLNHRLEKLMREAEKYKGT